MDDQLLNVFTLVKIDDNWLYLRLINQKCVLKLAYQLIVVRRNMHTNWTCDEKQNIFLYNDPQGGHSNDLPEF